MPDGFSFLPFSFGPIDDETRKKLEDEHNEQIRAALDFQHTLEEAWAKLSYEELYSLGQWLTMLANYPNDQIRSRMMFQSGALFRLAAERFKRCMVCDKNHDEEIERLRAEAESQSFTNKAGEARARQKEADDVQCICDGVTADACSVHGSKSVRPVADADVEAEASFQETQRIIAEHESKVKEYGLVQNFKKGGFNCVNCKMPYPSLEDRMLKPPGVEGCSGCIHKTKFG